MRLPSALSLSLVCTLMLPGCFSLKLKPTSQTKDRAFIEYWPASENPQHLRVAVKDLIDMKGVVTTAGSEYFFRNHRPAERDAECLAIARRRHVEFVGKTNLSEFAIGVSGMNEFYGTPRNRVGNTRRVPGGSSSGSAVAVKSGRADVALGTDTAGSIRVPAACTGTVGLKTTFGLVSLKGVHPIEPWHLDTVGPMGKDVKNTVRGMDLLQEGFAGKYQAAVSAHSNPRRIRIARLYVSGTDPDIEAAIDRVLEECGFQVVKLDEKFQKLWEQAEKDGRTMAAAGAWLSNREYGDKLGVAERSKAVMALGHIEYSISYKGALARREGWQRALAKVFEKVDFIALPTLKGPPPMIPFFRGSAFVEALVLGKQNTVSVNYAGNPALALPIPLARKRAVPFTSLQLIGRPRSEAELLNAGRIIEAKVSSPTSETRQAAASSAAGTPASGT